MGANAAGDQTPAVISVVPVPSKAAVVHPGAKTWNELTESGMERFATKDMKMRGDAGMRIEAALKSPTVMDFDQTPLGDVIDYLKDYHQIEIQFDKKAMDDAGINTDVPVTRSLKGISLKSALRLVLHDLGLTYVVENAALLITTPAEAERRLTARVHSVSDLVIPVKGPAAGLEGVGSLKIQLQQPAAAAGQLLTFRSLGTEPELVLTLADRGRFDALAWGLALAVGLLGVAMTNRPLRTKVSYIFAVALAATLLPLVWDDLEIIRTCNMVFFAASLLVPYYLLAGLLKWSCGALGRGGCCRAAPAKTAAVGLLAVLLAAAALSASAQTPKEGARLPPPSPAPPKRRSRPPSTRRPRSSSPTRR